jgi:hypothetical protein
MGGFSLAEKATPSTLPWSKAQLFSQQDVVRER